MQNPKHLSVLLLVLPFILCFISSNLKGQVKDSSVGTVIFLPIPKSPIGNQKPVEKTVVEPLNSMILTQEDFMDYIKSVIGGICKNAYNQGVAGRIKVYKDESLMRRYSKKELIDYSVNELNFPTKTYVADMPKNDTTPYYKIAVNRNTLRANALDIISGNDTLSSDPLIYCFMYYNFKNQYFGPSEKFYIQGSGIKKLLNYEQREIISKLMIYTNFLKLNKRAVTINDSTLREYFHTIFGGINYKFYKGVIDKKVNSYVDPTFLTVKYTIESVKRKSMVCETISVQIDPNDPYNTKDSTYCIEYTPDKVQSALKITFEDNGFVESLEPMMTFGSNPIDENGYNTMFSLKCKDATSLLTREDEVWIENVLFYKLQKLSW